MKELLRQYIMDNVSSPKKEEIEDILSIFKIKELKKGDYFKEPFKTGKEIGFLTDGAVRIIIFKENGEEVTVRIREENSFLADNLYLLDEVEASPIGIECLENQVLLVANSHDFQQLLEINLSLNILMRKHLSLIISKFGKQQMLFLTGSARERYQMIIKQFPNLLKKYPLKFIASMIGITPTQLSRIRNKK